ncbi:clustered mitochondria protein homolog isoform X1 [Antennarius striatus]|uniref:clustered mitochondria protein homolog isoform X1 n=1 Tax=Antennarius striatus TaxID=241820 RepID=UPI0035B0FA57
MGNIVQCCHTLLNYFKCKDAQVQSIPETSPLLSSEGSECDSLSLRDDLEDSLLTVSTAVTNPTLEPENFLFPDIILSSNLEGDVTLVEPMVCLLVSEDEDRVRVDELGDRAQERRNSWRNREYSEVETQTEADTQIDMGVQTQIELQPPAVILVPHNETVESEGCALRRNEPTKEVFVDVMGEHKILKEAILETQMSQERHSIMDCKTWSDTKDVVESEVSETVEKLTGFKGTAQESSHGELDKSHLGEETSTTSTKYLFQMEQNAALMCEINTDHQKASEMQPHTDCTLTENHTLQTNIKDKEDKLETEQTLVMLTEHDADKNDKTEKMGNVECGVKPTEERILDDEKMEQTGNVFLTKINKHLSDEQTNQAANQSSLNADDIQCQKILKPLKREVDDKIGAHQIWDLETALLPLDEEEENAKMKDTALFPFDRLFWASLNVKAPPSQIDKRPEDDPTEQPAVDQIKQLNIQEIAELQDTDFIVRIQPPGTESFDLQVSGQLMVSELHQVLMEHQITCHRTCFSLQLGGTAFNSHTRLSSIQGIQDGALIKVVEESYSLLDARRHLRHVRHLLRSVHPADAYNGVNRSSLSYLTFYTKGENGGETVGNRKASKLQSTDVRPPDYILPGCKDRPLTPLQPLRDDRMPLQCMRVLTLSSWNPPPGNRKMHGDLMYLSVLTMEDKEFNITSSTHGFYLNQSTAFNFNPMPVVPKILCHSLVELLGQVSPAFRKNFGALQKMRVQQHPYEQIATPIQVFTWAARQGNQTIDCVTVEELQPTRMGQEEHTAGKSRDWNEELQACRELSRNTAQERLHRERNIFKTNSDFVEAATRGAVAVIDGNIMPLNPGEAAHMQMFICNNLFFSLGFDICEHYRPLGGNTAAHAAAVCDLRGAQAYSTIDTEGLHTLGTAVVDYRSIRVIAQTIIPGILEKNQEQSVVYGSNDYGNTVFTHPRFLKLLDKTTKSLRIQRHQVLDHNNSPVELCTGIETKGIVGNDGRPYILDLLRTFPPDLNFQFHEREECSVEVPEECKSFGYPQQHCHSLASLRPELVEAFTHHRFKLYTNMVSQGLIQLEEQNKSNEESIGFEKRDVIMNPCKPVGSVNDSCFDIHFNPNVCCPGVRFPSECAAEVQRQKLLLWEMAAFLLSSQVPAVLKNCLDHAAAPMDGGTLTSVLHQWGVNIRYLGSLLEVLDRMEERGRLSYIQRICVSEVITRSAKHIFRIYLQEVEPAAYSTAISHFLNCLLGSSSCCPDSYSDELLSRRRSRRRRSHGSRLALFADSVWAKLTPSDLWARIRTEAQDYYHYTIYSDSIDEEIEKHSLQRISLLREFNMKTGVQVQLRDYLFESRHKSVFGEEDVVNMFPVVKHLRPAETDATQLVLHAQLAVQQGETILSLSADIQTVRVTVLVFNTT